MTDTSMRAQMRKFWEVQSQKSFGGLPAEELGSEEIPEVLSLLPDLKGKNVLELGAGRGRFTGHLCKLAGSVRAVDFLESSVEQNKAQNVTTNGKLTFLCSDVTELELPPKSVDFIFSNWMLMYLDDEECRQLLTKALSWLRDDGQMFFRESCFHQSGHQTDSSNENPTIYRLPAEYMDLVNAAYLDGGEESPSYSYELVCSRSIQAYVKRLKNTNQICWLLSKVKFAPDENQGFATFQQFLDSKQYSRNSILRYEKIFGHNFISTGGLETTEEFVPMLDLKPGQTVLDVGAGIGGSAFYMAEKHDVTVLAIDLSSNMTNIGLERANEIGENRVQFEIADATKRKFAPGTFDVIYSRDTILHIKDKHALFASFLEWLKPGGKLLISDYCCSEGTHSEVYKAYVKSRGYHVTSPKAYGKILEDVGFTNVRAEDRSEHFCDILKRELSKGKAMENEIVQEFSREDYEALINGWSEKIERVSEGDQKWGLFYAEKPN